MGKRSVLPEGRAWATAQGFQVYRKVRLRRVEEIPENQATEAGTGWGGGEAARRAAPALLPQHGRDQDRVLRKADVPPGTMDEMW